MAKIMVNVPYLEGQDINADASLKPYVNKGKPVLMLVYGSFCGYCQKVLPTVEALRQQLKNVEVVCVQMDAGEQDKAAARILSQVNKSPGVPAFLGFNAQGKFVKMHNGGRDAQSLTAFAQSL